MTNTDKNLHIIPFKAMGGPCNVHLYLADDQLHLSDELINEVRRIESKYSRFNENSVLSQINKNSSKGIVVDDETAGLLNYANDLYTLSDGLFDISSGILSEAWNFKSNNLPTKKSINEALKLVGWGKVSFDGNELKMPANMRLDLGGIGKEYAADCVANLARSFRIQHGLVDLGGDLSVIGPHPDGTPWRVGISNPRNPQEAIAFTNLHSGGLASSGDYERYMIINNKRYCHILNPKTGYPENSISGISIIANQCMIAGSIATIAMLKGKDLAIKWLDEQGITYVMVDKHLKISAQKA